MEYAVRSGLCDADRVGIMGWSYGGYLSAMCLARAPSVFRCAVAGAPVTHWDAYDTHYTERYMGGTPASHPEEYEESSVMHHVDGIEGALLLVHRARCEGPALGGAVEIVVEGERHERAVRLSAPPSDMAMSTHARACAKSSRNTCTDASVA